MSKTKTSGNLDRQPANRVSKSCWYSFSDSLLVETTVVMGAVLFVLGTHMKIERNAQGAWTVKIEKKPTDPKLLKSLMEKLLGFAHRDPSS